MKRLKGQVALVTGSSRGIGNAVAIALANEGASVVIDYLNEKTLAKKTAAEIRSLNVEALTFKVDVRDPIAIQNMVYDVEKHFGKIDILVNNAGIKKDCTLQNMTHEDWQNIIDVDLTGVFNCTKALLPSMIARGSGNIINITSLIGQIGNFGQVNYAAAKAGVIGFTKSLAKEVAPFGIRVNAVAPGFIQTSLLDSVPEGVKEKLRERISMKRFGLPSEIAGVVVFLSAKESSYLTGSVIDVNGGFDL